MPPPAKVKLAVFPPSLLLLLLTAATTHLCCHAVLTIQGIDNQNTDNANLTNGGGQNRTEKDTFETGLDGWTVENQSWMRKSIEDLNNVSQPPDNSSQVKVGRDLLRPSFGLIKL